MVQLTIFDVVSYKVGDIVKVINHANEHNPETYYYLQLFKNKEGKILEVIEKPRLQYRVMFKHREGYFYHEELKS
jgi:hypothetical protein